MSPEPRRSLSLYSDSMRWWCRVTIEKNKLSPSLSTDDKWPKLTLDSFGLYQSIGFKLSEGGKHLLLADLIFHYDILHRPLVRATA